MLFLTPLFDGLPKATLAAIIIAAVIGLVDVAGFRKLWRLDRDDARLALIAFAAVCFFGVLVGIVIAVVASLLALVQRSTGRASRCSAASRARRAPTRTSASATSSAIPSTSPSPGS